MCENIVRILICAGSKSLLGSVYGKPNQTIQLRDVACSGSEMVVNDCQYTLLSLEDGRALYSSVNVAGVECMEDITTATTDIISGSIAHEHALIGVGIVLVLLVVSILLTVR